MISEPRYKPRWDVESVRSQGNCTAMVSFRLLFDQHAQNINAIELYSHIDVSEDQLKYYNSGIGTYSAQPSWKSLSYYMQLLVENKSDLASAW